MNLPPYCKIKNAEYVYVDSVLQALFATLIQMIVRSNNIDSNMFAKQFA